MAAPPTYAARFARRREDARGFLYHGSPPGSSCMNQRDLMRKENDWVLYAFIIDHHGGETSVEQIRNSLSAWKRRCANNRRITQVMARNKRRGFEKLSETWEGTRFVSIWGFSGDLPEIDKKTQKNWVERLSPKGDK